LLVRFKLKAAEIPQPRRLVKRTGPENPKLQGSACPRRRVTGDQRARESTIGDCRPLILSGRKSADSDQAGLKALLEHGIELNIVADAFPKGLREH
jgi:hypothetical protein